MFILFATTAGYALFNILHEERINNTEALNAFIMNPTALTENIKLVAFESFDDDEASKAAKTIKESKLDSKLEKLMKNHFDILKECKLIVSDIKFKVAIKNNFDIECICDELTVSLMKGIRANVELLLKDVITQDNSKAISKDLLCTLSLDDAIIQSITLLDDIEKELKTYIVRVKEWYGWHFPELAMVVKEDSAYINTVICLQNRKNAQNAPLNEFLSADLVENVREFSVVSMGCEIYDDDMTQITELAKKVESMFEYRNSLVDYLKNRMRVVAPNLTKLVGELEGARLIARSGGLINLSKSLGVNSSNENVLPVGEEEQSIALNTKRNLETKQFLTVDILLEIFTTLFACLNDDWQFTALKHCSLVCKEWNELLDWKNHTKNDSNLWKFLLRNNSMILDNEDTTDIRKMISINCIPRGELIEISPNIEIDYFDFGNYQTFAEIHSFKMSKAFGFGVLKRMINNDKEIEQLFKEFITQANPDLYFLGHSLNSNLVDKYESSLDVSREEYNGEGTFEEEQKDLESNCLFPILTEHIRGEKVEISDLNHFRKFIKDECPIVVEYKDCTIGSIFSMAFLLITKHERCVYFEYCAEV